MKVLEIVTEPWVIHGREAGMGKGRAALRARAVELLASVGLTNQRSAATRTSSPVANGSASTLPAPWRSGPGC